MSFKRSHISVIIFGLLLSACSGCYMPSSNNLKTMIRTARLISAISENGIDNLNKSDLNYIKKTIKELSAAEIKKIVNVAHFSESDISTIKKEIENHLDFSLSQVITPLGSLGKVKMFINDGSDLRFPKSNLILSWDQKIDEFSVYYYKMKSIQDKLNTKDFSSLFTLMERVKNP